MGNRRPDDWLGRIIYFQVSGLGRRLSGTGVQVQVQVPGLIPEPDPVPVPAAETCDPRMPPVLVDFVALSFSNRQPITANRLYLVESAIVSAAASPPRHFFFGFPATSDFFWWVEAT